MPAKLKEAKKPKEHRKTSEITQDYANQISKAGQLQYQIHVLTQDLGLVNDVLRDLNLEFAASQEAEKLAAQSEPKKEEPNA